DGDDLLRAEQDGAADGHLADRTATPDRDGIGGLDIALDGGLPAGRENVAEEEHLFIAEPVRHLYVGGVRERYTEVLRLAAGITAGQVRVAEQACRGVAEHLVGD